MIFVYIFSFRNKDLVFNISLKYITVHNIVIMPCGIEIASTIELTFFSVSLLQKMIVEEMQDWNQK